MSKEENIVAEFGSKLLDRLIIPENLSFIISIQPTENSQQGGFTTAIGTLNLHYLSRGEGKIQMLEQHPVIPFTKQALAFKHFSSSGIPDFPEPGYGCLKPAIIPKYQGDSAE
jgi:hypothetical protein